MVASVLPVFDKATWTVLLVTAAGLIVAMTPVSYTHLSVSTSSKTETTAAATEAAETTAEAAKDSETTAEAVSYTHLC